MNRNRFALGAVFVVMVLSPMAQASNAVTKSYAAPSPALAVQSQLPGGTSVGGNWFSGGADQRPTSVSVQDASASAVSFMVCQDLNGDSVCGNRESSIGALEPRVSACDTQADLSTSAVPFNPGTMTRVFVIAADAACPRPATSGSITVTFS